MSVTLDTMEIIENAMHVIHLVKPALDPLALSVSLVPMDSIKLMGTVLELTIARQDSLGTPSVIDVKLVCKTVLFAVIKLTA